MCVYLQVFVGVPQGLDGVLLVASFHDAGVAHKGFFIHAVVAVVLSTHLQTITIYFLSTLKHDMVRCVYFPDYILSMLPHMTLALIENNRCISELKTTSPLRYNNPKTIPDHFPVQKRHE